MAGPVKGAGPEILRLTRGLVRLLHERTDKARPKPDEASGDLLWLADVRDHLAAAGSDVLLDLARPSFTAAPPLPEILQGRLDPEVATDSRVAAPRLALGDHPPAVRSAFDRWLREQRAWAAADRTAQRLQPLYDRLEQLLAQTSGRRGGDTLVLGLGLVTVVLRGAVVLHRHLLSVPVELRRDGSGALRLVLAGDARLRLDDRMLRQQPGGALVGRSDDEGLAGLHPFAEAVGDWLTGYVRDSWRGPVRLHPQQWEAPPPSVPDVPSLALAPALIVRSSTSGDQAGFYERMLASLEAPGATVPLGLAQLVTPIEPADRRRWLAAEGVPPIGQEPLFALRTNPEQRAVLSALRDDSVVVVQGPPGTGKTNTILNVVTALLADGQRVLVTSLHGAALNVIREQLPAPVRRLCVEMTEKSTAEKQLERSIKALTDLGAARSQEWLEQRIDELGRHRAFLLDERASAVTSLREDREREHREDHTLPEPYRGLLRDIAAAVSAGRERHGWIGDLPAGAPDAPPLADTEATELLELLRGRTDERERRGRQLLPAAGLVPAVESVGEAFERLAAHEALAGGSLDMATMARFTELTEPALAELRGRLDAAFAALIECGLGEVVAEWPADDWRRPAAEQLLAHRDAGFWNGLFDIVDEAGLLAGQLPATGRAVSFDPAPLDGTLPALLAQAVRLREHLARGGRIRPRWWERRSRFVAGELLEICTIGGAPPRTAGDLAAIVAVLRCEIAVGAALAAWAAVDVRSGSGPLGMRLAQLRHLGKSVLGIRRLLFARDAVQQVMMRDGLRYVVNSAERWDGLVRIVRNVEVVRAAQQARQMLDAACAGLRPAALDPAAAPETAALIEAIASRDLAHYRSAADGLLLAAGLQAEHRREAELLDWLRAAHRDLAERLAVAAADPAWDQRLATFDETWAWGRGLGHYRGLRSDSTPHDQAERVDELDAQLREITAELAGARGLRHYLRRTSEEQRQALQDYRIARAALGLGSSTRYGPRHASDARDAMYAARGAVPAWVMPLDTVAEHVQAEPNSFDVIVVDEASQVGVDWLLLLWLAPRIVIVGDDQQCTPSDSGKSQEDLDAIDHHLREMPTFRGGALIPGRSLYELMSARVPQVIRLTEHFRSMPEIIGWSQRFYDGELMPLRQFGADRLPPLVMVPVQGEMQGRADDAVNRAEVAAIVEQVEKMVADPAYQDRTIAVIALHSKAQVAELDRELKHRIKPTDIERFNIRVGQPEAFQGDQRSVVLLSMVYHHVRPAFATSRKYRQLYNVAVSRAEDQVWLFTSVPPLVAATDVKDMRAALLAYFRDPQPVSRGRHRLRFRSRFHQDVCDTLRRRGYRVTPLYPIRDGHVDLLVIGEHGQLAVICDGPREFTSAESRAGDVDRELELRRCGWAFVRIRESDYRFDPQAALEPLWQRLKARGIEPHDDPPTSRRDA
ncbi:AAA domain-containing protein [Dactylosporangium sp. CS-047395]|uniref:AAA domain-containing protein n=1 Tax=Dactylosporangium sp. CS-047395 TaxID=3239936 RepID=UPI003D94B1B4